MGPEPYPAAPRLSDLTGAGPADVTLRNFLDIVSAKLELCGRLAAVEYEATVEGHTSAAATFHELAVSERRASEELLRSLHRYLGETIAPGPSERR